MDYLLAIIVVVATAVWWLNTRSTKSTESGKNFKRMEFMTDDEVVELCKLPLTLDTHK